LELVPGDGCGNRFLLAQAAEFQSAAAAAGGELALTGAVCRAGDVDGLLLVQEQEGALSVAVRNCDGSDGGACLNGLRVAAAWRGGTSGLLRMAGQEVRWRRDEETVALDLPLDTTILPLEPLPLAMLRGVPGAELLDAGAAVSFWNPHAVFRLVKDVDLAAFPLDGFAARVRADEARFPDGVNVSVVVPEDEGHLRMRVDERGVGETAACGSAAVAAAVQAWRGGADARLELRMSGGTLVLERLPGGRTGLTGAARLEPPIDLEELLSGSLKSL
jgi:diaminopimelate epimerase